MGAIKELQLILTVSEFGVLERVVANALNRVPPKAIPSSDLVEIHGKIAILRDRLDRALKLLERVPTREG